MWIRLFITRDWGDNAEFRYVATVRPLAALRTLWWQYVALDDKRECRWRVRLGHADDERVERVRLEAVARTGEAREEVEGA